MKRTILFLSLALMIVTCIALPNTNYKKTDTVNIPTQREMRRQQAREITSETLSRTTTEEVTEPETYIYNAAEEKNTENIQSPQAYPRYSSSYEAVEIKPSAAPSDTFTINGISINIGDNIADITSELGKPINTIYVPIDYSDEVSDNEEEPAANAEGETETTTARPLARADENAYGYDGFTIYTNDNKTIEKIEVNDPSIPAFKGVSPIGMQVFDLADSYGGPVAVEGNVYRFAAGKGIYMYFDAPGGTVRSWGIVGK